MKDQNHPLINSNGFAILKRWFAVCFIAIALTSLSSCSRTGIYSIIVAGNVQAENNDLNDLGAPYKKKKIISPGAIVYMSEEEKRKWKDTLNQFKVHTVDTFVKISFIKSPGLVMLNLRDCGSNGVAIIVLDEVKTRKNGKIIDIKLQYVCKNDNPGVDWGVPGRIWAATKSHKIDVLDPNLNCNDGFHSVEFQFSPEKENPLLRSVLIVCADE